MSKNEALNLDNITSSGTAAALVGAVGGLADTLISGTNVSVAGNLTGTAAALGIAGIALLGGANPKPERTVIGAMAGMASVFMLAAGMAAHNLAPADKAPAVDIPAPRTSPAPAVKPGSLLPLPPSNL